QEAAARALGLDLELTTVDTAAFPDDLLRLTWFQDQPVIGAALIPMYHVSRLAARSVKVCLGGQGADEIFGGYARYALVTPARAQFESTIARSPALTPGDKILHWDIQTYLTGLFQQDDRMSMANSVESRVPMADPRIVRFALHTNFDLKLRGGATKWVLRQAV